LGPKSAMDKIAGIARQRSPSIHDTAVATVLRLMTSTDRLGPVLRSVVNWAEDWESYRHEDGLRSVARDIGTYLLRMIDRRFDLKLDPADVADRYPHDCKRLVSQIIDDRIHGIEVLNYLLELANWHHLIAADETARQHATELVRITRLLAPGLRWRERCRAVSRLCRRHPIRRHDVRYIFRIARKAERSGLCGGAGTPVSRSGSRPA